VETSDSFTGNLRVISTLFWSEQRGFDMKTGSMIAIVAAAALVAVDIFSFDLEQAEQVSLPDVDTGDIGAGTNEVTVTVLTFDVESSGEERTEANYASVALTVILGARAAPGANSLKKSVTAHERTHSTHRPSP
jgi:hypothetical protein